MFILHVKSFKMQYNEVYQINILYLIILQKLVTKQHHLLSLFLQYSLKSIYHLAFKNMSMSLCCLPTSTHTNQTYTLYKGGSSILFHTHRLWNCVASYRDFCYNGHCASFCAWSDGTVDISVLLYIFSLVTLLLSKISDVTFN